MVRLGAPGSRYRQFRRPFRSFPGRVWNKAKEAAEYVAQRGEAAWNKTKEVAGYVVGKGVNAFYLIRDGLGDIVQVPYNQLKRLKGWIDAGLRHRRYIRNLDLEAGRLRVLLQDASAAYMQMVQDAGRGVADDHQVGKAYRAANAAYNDALELAAVQGGFRATTSRYRGLRMPFRNKLGGVDESRWPHRVWNRVKETGKNAWGLAKDIGGDVWNRTKGAAVYAYENPYQVLADLHGGVTDAWKRTKGAVKRAYTHPEEVVMRLRDGVGRFVDVPYRALLATVNPDKLRRMLNARYAEQLERHRLERAHADFIEQQGADLAWYQAQRAQGGGEGGVGGGV